MLKKRLVGIVNIKNGLVVQSIGYKKYLPLGSPEIIVENLDRWQIDEIIINCIDRSIHNEGVSFNILKSISKRKISTPIIYSGGVKSVEHAYKAIKFGADRICINNLITKGKETLIEIVNKIGKQALILSCPLVIKDNLIYHFNYVNKEITLLEHWMKNYFFDDLFSEILITDVINEGGKNSFNQKIIETARNYFERVIVFGGITEPSQIEALLNHNFVSAVAIGNSLSFSEHALFNIKKSINSKSIRMVSFSRSNHFN